MPQLDPYLFFDGNCAEAMRFYERTLGGKIEMMMTHKESPMAAQASAGNADRIMHASLTFDGGRRLMASDAMAEHTYERMQGFSLAWNVKTAAEARKTFAALSDGGKVIMPMEKTFWSEAFGMLVDRYGTPWMVGVETAKP